MSGRESPLPPEFSLIARHFRPLAGPGARDLRDDVAVLAPPPGRELVLTVDAMVAGVHFLPDDPPDLIGRKLLRVNLSDIAAKGATPLGYLLTVSAPRGTADAWFAGFAAGLAADQREFAVTLLGGDTTSTPGPVSLSLTLIGHVAPGQAPSRGGARAGDGIWVTGTIGDGALGLAVAQGRLDDPSGFLLDRYRLPRPRLGMAVGGYASAAMDVSDGLVQDLSHICRASGLAARDRRCAAAAVRCGAPGRAGLAAHLPHGRGRLRIAAGGAAVARGGVAGGRGACRHPGHPHRRFPARAGQGRCHRRRPAADGDRRRRLEPFLSRAGVQPCE